MKKHAAKIQLGLIVLLFAVATFLVLSFSVRSRAIAMQNAPTTTQLEVALRRVGLDPEALAAAAVAPSATDDVVQAVLEHLAESGSAIALADQQYDAANVSADALARKVRAGVASEEELGALTTAQASLSSVAAQRQTLLTAMFDAGTAVLPAAQRDTLTQIRGNRGWKLAMEFLVVDRTEPDWVSLRDALANERIALERGEEPDAEATALLSEARADAPVSSANASLASNLAAVNTAWEGELEPD